MIILNLNELQNLKKILRHITNVPFSSPKIVGGLKKSSAMEDWSSPIISGNP